MNEKEIILLDNLSQETLVHEQIHKENQKPQKLTPEEYYKKIMENENRARIQEIDAAEAYKALDEAVEKVIASNKEHQVVSGHKVSGHPSAKELADMVRKKLDRKTDIPQNAAATKAKEIDKAWAEHEAKQAEEKNNNAKLTAKEIKEYLSNQNG